MTTIHETVARRLVFLFPGFEPMGVDAHVARFRRASERSAEAFGVRVDFRATSGTQARIGANIARLDADLTTHKGQSTRTTLVFCDWSDLIRAYAARPLPVRLARGLAGLFDVVVTGTLFRYLGTSWRYGFFFAYPIVALLGALALAATIVAAVAINTNTPAGIVAALAIALIAAAGLLWFIDRRWHLMTALDDWALARDMCRSRNPAITERIAHFAAVMADQAGGEAGQRADEIVIAAHSLGAGFAVPALARACADGLAPPAPLHVLTVGSSLMKTALHPSARFQREAVRRILVDFGIPWTDCQAISDPIHFYKSNPAGSLNISADPMPTVVKVRFRRMVSPETYRRIKRDFFRLHRQFVLAVERRCPYSFHMLLLGPASMIDFQRTHSVDRPPLVASAPADGGADRPPIPDHAA